MGEFAEGAVVGSAIVELIERNPGKEAAVCGTIHKAAFSRQLSAFSSQEVIENGAHAFTGAVVHEACLRG